MQTVATDPAVLAGAAATAAGRRHELNEDANTCGPVWFAVADGMGGHRAGDVASRVAVRTLGEQPAPRTRFELEAAIREVNDAIRERGRRTATAGMGTTIVGVVAVGGDVAVVHVGDSRCYRLRAGALTLATRDHSHVQELLDGGRISPDEARRHRFRNVVTRALGADDAVRPEIALLARPVGRLLLCSDGLTAELSARTIGRVLLGVADPQAAADRLVELALAGDAQDDITAVVVDEVGAA